MFEVYRQSWACLRQNIWIYLAVAMIPSTLGLFIQGRGSLGANVFLTIWLAFELHRHFLFGERPFYARSNAGRKKGWFATVSLCLMGAAAALAIFLAIRLHILDQPERFAELGLFAVYTIVNLLTLSLFGSALPAAAAQEGFSLSLTLARIRTTAFPTFLGLLAGPGLSSLVLLSALFGVGVTVAMAIGHQNVIPDAAFKFTFGVLTSFVSVFATTLAVAVLCRSYRLAVPASDPA